MTRMELEQQARALPTSRSAALRLLLWKAATRRPRWPWRWYGSLIVRWRGQA
jgi:hypothetical protein